MTFPHRKRQKSFIETQPADFKVPAYYLDDSVAGLLPLDKAKTPRAAAASAWGHKILRPKHLIAGGIVFYHDRSPTELDRYTQKIGDFTVTLARLMDEMSLDEVTVVGHRPDPVLLKAAESIGMYCGNGTFPQGNATLIDSASGIVSSRIGNTTSQIWVPQQVTELAA